MDEPDDCIVANSGARDEIKICFRKRPTHNTDLNKRPSSFHVKKNKIPVIYPLEWFVKFFSWHIEQFVIYRNLIYFSVLM